MRRLERFDYRRATREAEEELRSEREARTLALQKAREQEARAIREKRIVEATIAKRKELSVDLLNKYVTYKKKAYKRGLLPSIQATLEFIPPEYLRTVAERMGTQESSIAAISRKIWGTRTAILPENVFNQYKQAVGYKKNTSLGGMQLSSLIFLNEGKLHRQKSGRTDAIAAHETVHLIDSVCGIERTLLYNEALPFAISVFMLREGVRKLKSSPALRVKKGPTQQAPKKTKLSPTYYSSKRIGAQIYEQEMLRQ